MSFVRGLHLPLPHLPMLQHYRRAGHHDRRAHKELGFVHVLPFYAGGERPQPQARKSQRLKNRVGHKFIWYPEVHGEPSCTGCGRCIRHCPVSMDISRIVTLLSGREENTMDAA